MSTESHKVQPTLEIFLIRSYYKLRRLIDPSRAKVYLKTVREVQIRNDSLSRPTWRCLSSPILIPNSRGGAPLVAAEQSAFLDETTFFATTVVTAKQLNNLSSEWVSYLQYEISLFDGLTKKKLGSPFNVSVSGQRINRHIKEWKKEETARLRAAWERSNQADGADGYSPANFDDLIDVPDPKNWKTEDGMLVLGCSVMPVLQGQQPEGLTLRAELQKILEIGRQNRWDRLPVCVDWFAPEVAEDVWLGVLSSQDVLDSKETAVLARERIKTIVENKYKRCYFIVNHLIAALIPFADKESAEQRTRSEILDYFGLVQTAFEGIEFLDKDPKGLRHLVNPGLPTLLSEELHYMDYETLKAILDKPHTPNSMLDCYQLEEGHSTSVKITILKQVLFPEIRDRFSKSYHQQGLRVVAKDGQLIDFKDRPKFQRFYNHFDLGLVGFGGDGFWTSWKDQPSFMFLAQEQAEARKKHVVAEMWKENRGLLAGTYWLDHSWRCMFLRIPRKHENLTNFSDTIKEFGANMCLANPSSWDFLLTKSTAFMTYLDIRSRFQTAVFKVSDSTLPEKYDKFDFTKILPKHLYTKDSQLNTGYLVQFKKLFLAIREPVYRTNTLALVCFDCRLQKLSLSLAGHEKFTLTSGRSASSSKNLAIKYGARFFSKSGFMFVFQAITLLSFNLFTYKNNGFFQLHTSDVERSLGNSFKWLNNTSDYRTGERYVWIEEQNLHFPDINYTLKRFDVRL